MGDKIDGLKEMQATFSKMKRGAFRQVAIPAMNAALDVLVEEARSDVPPELSHVRRLIRKRIVKVSDTEVIGKVGWGVGQRGSKSKRGRTAFGGTRTSHGGVGINTNNIHWFLIGTGQRYTLKNHAYRGVMEPLQGLKLVLADAFGKGSGNAIRAAVEEYRARIREQWD